MAARNWLLYTMLFVGGMAVGIGGHQINTRAAQAASAAAKQRERKTTDDELLRLRKENAELVDDIENLRAQMKSAQTSALKAQTLARLSALVETKKDGLSAISLLNFNGQIDELFAQLYDLSPDERAKLNKTVATTRDTVNRLELSHTQVARIAPNQVQFTVEPFPAEGGKVYDAALAEIAATLGPDRYKAFLKLSGESVEHGLGYFGARSRKITVTEEAEGPIRFKTAEEIKSAEFTGTSSGTFLDETQVRDSLKHLSVLYPSMKE